MKKRILNAALMVCLLLGGIMLTGCSNASKSVLEPLTQQEREKLIEEDEKNGTQLAKTGSIIVRYSYDENNAISLACEYRQS